MLVVTKITTIKDRDQMKVNHPLNERRIAVEVKLGYGFLFSPKVESNFWKWKKVEMERVCQLSWKVGGRD